MPPAVVSLYWVDLHSAQSRADAFSAVLSTTESERLARLRFEKDRIAFSLSHATLRILLGRYLNLEPEQVKLETAPAGKPSLQSPNTAGLQFNMSHSGSLLGLAVSRERAVGVDIETVNPLPELHRLISQVFTASERRAILAQPEAQRLDTFYAVWTCKEALLKAAGSGLGSISPNTFSVPIPEILDQPSQVSFGDEANESWTLCSFSPWPGAVGALCYAGNPCAVEVQHLDIDQIAELNVYETRFGTG